MIKNSQVCLGARTLTLPFSKNNEGHFLPILAKIESQVSAMLSHHCKILAVRLDLHVYDQSSTNEVISKLIRWLRKHLQQRLGLSNVGYIWCREQGKASKQHYHLVVMVDANKHRHPTTLVNLVCRYWQAKDIGTVWIPKHCYYVIKRGDDEAFQKLFNRLSYLAKVATKAPINRNATSNDYEGSRVKFKASK